MSEVSNDVDKQLCSARSLRFIVDELKPIFNREVGCRNSSKLNED